jgi:hypothetical protein
MAGRQAYQSYHTKVPDSKIGTKRTDVFFWKVTRFENCLNFKTHVRLFFKNEPVGFDMFSVYLHFDRGTPGPPTDQTTNWPGDRVWRSIFLMLTHNSALYWIHVSSGDFTTVEMNTIERTLNNSCSQSLARKRDSWKLQSMFSKHFSSGWIWMVTSVCWNISTLHYRGRNHPNRGFRSNLKVGLGISRTSVDSQ